MPNEILMDSDDILTALKRKCERLEDKHAFLLDFEVTLRDIDEELQSGGTINPKSILHSRIQSQLSRLDTLRKEKQ